MGINRFMKIVPMFNKTPVWGAFGNQDSDSVFCLQFLYFQHQWTSVAHFPQVAVSWKFTLSDSWSETNVSYKILKQALWSTHTWDGKLSGMDSMSQGTTDTVDFSITTSTQSTHPFQIFGSISNGLSVLRQSAWYATGAALSLWAHLELRWS